MWRISIAAALIALSGGCRGPAPGRPTVRIAAASDLNVALGVLVAKFGEGRAVDVNVSYGSSGSFYAQLLNQAPFDMFFSADVDYPRRLQAAGHTLPGAEFVYGVGRLVLWVPNASPLDVEHDGLRALTDARVRHVAIANPEHAPYGRAAVAAIRAAGVHDSVTPKIVQGENVAQAMQFVQSGAADAGIVALSLALAPNAKGTGRWAEVPLNFYPRMEQGGTILKWAADADAARAFRAFVLGADGRAILKQYGFFLPEP
jgi:molybdate transport system substrate-binding protein